MAILAKKVIDTAPRESCETSRECRRQALDVPASPDGNNPFLAEDVRVSTEDLSRARDKRGLLSDKTILREGERAYAERDGAT
jgi:hypothetical protein